MFSSEVQTAALQLADQPTLVTVLRNSHRAVSSQQCDNTSSPSKSLPLPLESAWPQKPHYYLKLAGSTWSASAIRQSFLSLLSSQAIVVAISTHDNEQNTPQSKDTAKRNSRNVTTDLQLLTSALIVALLSTSRKSFRVLDQSKRWSETQHSLTKCIA